MSKRTKKPALKRKKNMARRERIYPAVTGTWNAPPRYRAQFRYSLMAAINNAGAQSASVSYNLSEPQNITGSANVAPGFASFWNGGTSLYGAYRVQGARVVARMVNLDSATAPRVSITWIGKDLAANAVNTLVLQNQYLATPYSKDVILGVSAGNAKGVIKTAMNLQKLYGANTFVNNDLYSYYVEADGTLTPPVNKLKLLVFIWSVTNLTSGVQIAFDFTFDVEFYQRVNAQS